MEEPDNLKSVCVCFHHICQLPKLYHETACSCRATLLKRCHQCPQRLGIRPCFLAGCHISCCRIQSDVNYSSTIFLWMFLVCILCASGFCPTAYSGSFDGLGLVQFPLVYGEARENPVA